MHRNDRRLVTETLNGDQDAFAVLMRRYERRVYAIAYAKLVNHADAEEMTQQTFLHAYERLWQIKTPDRFGSWIARVALTCVSAHKRRRMRETLMDVSTVYAEQPAPEVDQERFERDEDARRLVERGLRTLPDSLRLALVLRYMSDATYDEVARSLMIPRAAAERRVQRGLRKLQDYFRRCGVADAAGSSALTGTLTYPVGVGVIDAAIADVRGSSPPSRAASSSSTATLAAAGVAGTLITGLLACGLFVSTWAEMRGGPAASAESGSRVVLVGRPAPSYGADPQGVLTRQRVRGPIPRNAVLILDETYDGLVPGQALPGWTSGAYAQSEDLPPGGGAVAGMVNTNIPAAYFQFPLVRGRVTFELWLKPGSGPDVNCVLRMGSHLRGWRDAKDTVHATRPDDGDAVESAMFVIKNDQDLWFYDSPIADGDLGFLGPYDGSWRHVRLVYDTSRNDYDVYLDGQTVRRHIPGVRDISEGISNVSISSGRWERELDAPSYFDGVRVYVQPLPDGAT